MKRKIAGKTYTIINNLKNEIYTIWREFDDKVIIKTWMSIYDRMNDKIEEKGCMIYYLFFNLIFISLIFIYVNCWIRPQHLVLSSLHFFSSFLCFTARSFWFLPRAFLLKIFFFLIKSKRIWLKSLKKRTRKKRHWSMWWWRYY